MSSPASNKRKQSTIQFPRKRPRQDPPASPGAAAVDPMRRSITAPARTSSSAAGAGGAPAAKKKMVIKPFKVQPKLPENFEDATWAQLREAVVAVQEKRPVLASREELYRAVEDLCLHKMAPRLHQRLLDECDRHIGACVSALVGCTPEHAAFLGLVDQLWDDFCRQMLTIRSIFLYLDRTYVMQAAGARSLWDAGLQLLRAHLERHAEVLQKTMSGVLAQVERERHGESVARPLLRSVLRMLSALKLYSAPFEPLFLEATTAFYTTEGARLVQQLDPADFLLHAQTRLAEEQERVVHYLDHSTRTPLVRVVETELLAKHTQQLLEKGFEGLMDSNRLDDLARLYSLYKRVDALAAVQRAVKLYIVARGREIVTDEEKDKTMVQDLLSLKARVDAVVERAFTRNEEFRLGVREAFEDAINARENRPAELMAKYCDLLLKAGNKSAAEEVEVQLDQVIDLFRFINGKDVFEAFFKKDLAKRLLLGKSASTDLEKSMLHKLKTECGATFTNKLEGMFKDVELSKDIMTSFRQSATSREPSLEGVDVHVHVLTTGFWPAYAPMEIRLPEVLARFQQIFQAFYLSKYSGRSLTWQHSLGQCVLKARFPKGRRELSVSLLQTAVLLLFNSEVTIPFLDIKEQTAIEDGELRRTLQSLACGKVRVLRKEPKGPDVGDEDVFHFNAGFESKLYRIKVNSIQMKETAEEKAVTDENVMRNRQYQIDAAAVRIMKTRKTLSHAMLMSELFSQLKFPAKAADLKKRIESLIEREYLERDEKNPSLYNYLA